MEFNFSPVKKDPDENKDKKVDNINEDKLKYIHNDIISKVNYIIDNTNDKWDDIIRYLSFNYFKESTMNKISLIQTNLIVYVLFILLNIYNVRLVNPKTNSLLIWVYLITIIPIISFIYLAYQNTNIEKLIYFKSESEVEYIKVLEKISEISDKCKYTFYMNIFTIPIVIILLAVSIFK